MMELKTFLRISPILLTFIFNTGCSDLRQAIGKEKFVPDEYSVMKTPILIVPPGFGVDSKVFENKTNVDQNEIIFLDRKISNNEEFKTLFETKHIPPNIRQLVDEETLGISRSARRGIDILMGTNPEVGVILESEKETKRIRKNKRNSKSILDGSSPSFDTENNTKVEIK